MKKSNCPHNRVAGDNYGETCMDCGMVLKGFGYWGEGTTRCIHEWIEDPETGELFCPFCEETKLSPKGLK